MFRGGGNKSGNVLGPARDWTKTTGSKIEVGLAERQTRLEKSTSLNEHIVIPVTRESKGTEGTDIFRMPGLFVTERSTDTRINFLFNLFITMIKFYFRSIYKTIIKNWLYEEM